MVVRVAGIDLAAKESRCSGYALIVYGDNFRKLIKVKCLYSNDEVVNELLSDGVSIVAIDAPITNNPRMRSVDREMIRRGFKVFPPNFKWMRELSVRAYCISNELISKGVKVIETHPRSAMINSGVSNLEDMLNKLGIYNEVGMSFMEHKDLRDAVISALVALCLIIKCVDVVSSYDGEIYLLSRLTK